MSFMRRRCVRPVKLTLEGFTSFASRAEIDFRPLDLFAITGQTGAGKSSILDGILFALFGETARKVTVPELRTQGSAAMRVQLEFAVGKREFLVSRVYQGKSAVDFKLHERQGEEWKLVTAQAKQGNDDIQHIVGLDFHGFTRAVILPQGAFDEFLRGDAQQRTKILTDLLNLQLYQVMMQSANARSARLRGETDLLKKQLERDFADATDRHQEELEIAIAATRKGLESNRAQQEELAPVRGVAAQLKNERARAKRLIGDLDAARLNQAAKSKAAEETKRLIEQTAQRQADAEAAISASPFQPAVYEQLVEVTPLARQIEMLKSDLSQRRARQKEKAASRASAEQAAQQAITALAAAQQALQVQSYADARKQFGSREVALRLAVDFRASAIADADARERACREALEQTEREWEHVRGRALRQHLKAGEPCPVCEQVVKKLPKDAGETTEAVRQRRDEAQREYNQLQVAIAKHRECRAQAAKLVGESADMAGALEALGGNLDQLEQAERQAESAHRDLQAHQAEAARLDEEIRQGTERLRTANQEFQKYPDWNALPFEELEENLKQQRDFKARHETLMRDKDSAAKAHSQALEASTKVQAELLFLERAIQEKAAECESAAATIASFEQQLAAWQGREDLVEQAVRRLTDEANVLLQKLGQTESRLEALIEKRKRAREIQADLESKTADEVRYRELGTLLNAKNFIAYVQRQMLERLATLASEQLRTLSESRYTLTLSHDSNDFFVQDHWNAGAMRSAKTLSGGESFLASLSLALALSDSVTGFGQQARLESLFLDEGFSTLDSDSLQTAIEAIQTLASSRRMVGVISHLPQLAEQLPAKLEVVKSATGSSVRTLHSHSMVAGGL